MFREDRLPELDDEFLDLYRLTRDYPRSGDPPINEVLKRPIDKLLRKRLAKPPEEPSVRPKQSFLKTLLEILQRLFR
ncbi:MAG: hypothetical protein GTO24_23090 [candidate division Zixibacteria bacterium]|nr:hypothetical protein [candidate division Zixibacteria bacterium]